MNFLRVQSEVIPVKPETVFTIGSFEVTNSIMLGVVITVLLAFFVLMLKSRLSLKPSKLQTVVEMAVESMLDLISQITNSRKKALALLPLLGTIFVFFMISNLITLIPGLGQLTYNGVSVFRGPTNDFNMTFSVALAVVVITQIMSIKQFGVFGHLGKYFKFKELYLGFKKGIGDGMVAVIDFLIGLLDIISELAKVFSLSLRLFGNMFAGEILLALLLGGFALIVPTVWLGMNLLVGVIQAIVFGALSAAYFSMATEDSEPEESLN